MIKAAIFRIDNTEVSVDNTRLSDEGICYIKVYNIKSGYDISIADITLEENKIYISINKLDGSAIVESIDAPKFIVEEGLSASIMEVESQKEIKITLSDTQYVKVSKDCVTYFNIGAID